MNSKYKDKLVGVYAPGSYNHTSENIRLKWKRWTHDG